MPRFGDHAHGDLPFHLTITDVREHTVLTNRAVFPGPLPAFEAPQAGTPVGARPLEVKKIFFFQSPRSSSGSCPPALALPGGAPTRTAAGGWRSFFEFFFSPVLKPRHGPGPHPRPGRPRVADRGRFFRADFFFRRLKLRTGPEPHPPSQALPGGAPRTGQRPVRGAFAGPFCFDRFEAPVGAQAPACPRAHPDHRDRLAFSTPTIGGPPPVMGGRFLRLEGGSVPRPGQPSAGPHVARPIAPGRSVRCEAELTRLS